MQISDVDDAHEIFSDPRVFEFFGKGIRTRQQIEATTVRIAAKWKKENRGDFAVCLGSKMIGQMLVLENDEKEFELGYVFNPSFWGQGYAAEACRAALRYDFEERGASHVVACIRDGNKRSLRILCRLLFSERSVKTGDDGLRRFWFILTQENWKANQSIQMDG